MPDENNKPGAPESTRPTESPDDAAVGSDEDRSGAERSDRGITDFVRRAVSAGVVAASRSKDDIVRVAAGEVRGWLDHLNLNDEIAKALAKMVIEVKTEIRFRPAPPAVPGAAPTDGGRPVPHVTNEVKIKGP